MALSKAAIAIHCVLEENSPEAKALRKRFHRVSLSKWRNGRGTPYADTAGEIEVITRGRVRANQWTGGKKRRRVSNRDPLVRTAAQ